MTRWRVPAYVEVEAPTADNAYLIAVADVQYLNEMATMTGDSWMPTWALAPSDKVVDAERLPLPGQPELPLWTGG